MPTASRMYAVVLDGLEERLRSGGISVGDKLPGERPPAEVFGISRASVQETVAGLEDWPAVRRTLQEQHREILSAVQERRGRDASGALREHITWFFGRGTTAQDGRRGQE